MRRPPLSPCRESVVMEGGEVARAAARAKVGLAVDAVAVARKVAGRLAEAMVMVVVVRV